MSAVADVRPALIGHLKDLHLPTVRECYEETARRAERETLSYEACDIPNTCRPACSSVTGARTPPDTDVVLMIAERSFLDYA